MKMRRLTAAFVTAAMILSPAGGVYADPVPVTEETAFSAAWDEISGVLLDTYTAAHKAVSSVPGDEDLPAYRLSIEPDALKLLGFASESLIKTDLSWIDEIGIDLLPSIQNIEYTYYYYNGPATQEVWLPGLCAALHVNGKEILTADIINELGGGYACVKLPELVGGSYYTEMSSAYSGLENLFSFMYGSFDRQNFVRTILESDKLLPDPELFGMILETAGSLSEIYTPEEAGEKDLSAGDVSEKVMSYTGRIRAKDLISVLYAFMDRLDQDEEFRNAVISCVDGFYELLENNYFLKNLLQYSGANYIYRIAGGDGYAAAYAALLTGNWKFADESLNQTEEQAGADSAEEAASAAAESMEETASAAADSAEEAASTEAAVSAVEAAFEDNSGSAYEAESDGEALSDEGTESSEEDRGTKVEDITLKPGREYSWEEVNSNMKDVFLMLQGIADGSIILTGDQSAGNNIYTVYRKAYSQIRDALSDLAEETDETAALKITTAFDAQQKLKGISLDPVMAWEEAAQAAEDEDGEAPRSGISSAPEEEESHGGVSLVWPESGEGKAVSFEIHTPWETVASVLVQALADSFKAELYTGEIGTMCLSGEKTAGEDGDVYTARLSENEETAAWFEGNVVADGTGIDLSLHIPRYDNRETKARLTGSYDAESGKGSFKLVISDGSTGYPENLYQSERAAFVIETDRLRAKKDGTLTGKVSVSQTGKSAMYSPVPQGMKLIFDFGKGQAAVADSSSTYLTFSRTEKPVISEKKAKNRIRKAWEDGMAPGFGRNWNFAYPLSRLLKAGMPEDLLNGLPLTMEEITDLIEDLMYDLNYMSW